MYNKGNIFPSQLNQGSCLGILNDLYVLLSGMEEVAMEGKTWTSLLKLQHLQYI